jgi:hypothetical protein
MDERQLTNTEDKALAEYGWEIRLQTNPEP